MAHLIKGTIKNSKTNAGISGLKIQAYDDDDWSPNDDYMGQSYTDLNGKYKIDYKNKKWDTDIYVSESWRPDIYIKILIKNYRNKWVKMWKSDVKSDHKMSIDLFINKTLTIENEKIKNTDFNPQVHGFKFHNQFSGSVSLFGISLGEFKMGFCGGMCGGALNRFKNNIEIPNNTEPPVEGSDLFGELYSRQLISLNGIIDNIVYWQNLPDESHTYLPHSVGYRTRDEWWKLKEEIDAGKPTPIVVITKEGVTADYFENHQVLAIGYKFNPNTKDVWIYVYDPNHPNSTQIIYMSYGLPKCKLDATYSSSIPGNRIRGFFINPNRNLMSSE
jgi:hypothetical protein